METNKKNDYSNSNCKTDSDDESPVKKCRSSSRSEEKVKTRASAVSAERGSAAATAKRGRTTSAGTNTTSYKLDSPSNASTIPSPSKDGKRANKPLMEKRRRARINQSLALLKTLILDSTKNDNTRHSKLEKADILELTVRYLQRQKILNSEVLDKYKAGFQECTREVTRFLDTPELHLCGESTKSSKINSTNSLKSTNSIFIEPAVKQRLLRHLNTCSSEIDLDFSKTAILQDNQMNVSQIPNDLCSTPPYPVSETSSIKRETPSVKSESTESDIEANSMQKDVPFENKDDSSLSVVQVIPSRLSDGQVVFLLPSHYMQLAEEFKKKATFTKRVNDDPNEPLDFSIKREDYMWRPW